MIKEKFCKLHADFEPYRNQREWCLRKKQSIISVQMPTSLDIKAFLLAIAEVMHKGPYYVHSSRAFLRVEIYRLLRGSEVKMIIIDELHNILAGSSRQQLEFLNLLRHMGNELQVLLICFGTKDAYFAIKCDPQLENRFESLILPLWEEGGDLGSLLESFVALLPLEKYSKLADPKIIKFLLRKSEGSIEEIAAILKMAATCAI